MIQKIHESAKCTVDVDSDVQPLMQFILDTYAFGLVPFASCQGNIESTHENPSVDAAYLSLIVRDMHAFDTFLQGVFRGVVKLKVELSYKKGFSQKLAEYRLEWPASFNKTITSNISNLTEDLS
jgi:hypothetical protein